MLFRRLFSRSDNEEISASLYAQIVAHARQPEFYSILGVPDTLDGRFDMLVLHTFLFFRRLKSEGETGKTLGQAVFDAMFKDLDEVVRELGVSDIAVVKRIKKMASAFYGRTGAYDAALNVYATEPSELAAALQRNIYPEHPVGKDELLTLATYVAECESVLSEQNMPEIVRGNVRFASVPDAVLITPGGPQIAG